MAEYEIDISAYLSRIGFDGIPDCSLQTLKRIILLHQYSIAFENLNSFAGLPVTIDPAAIEEKIIRQGRGGYCYEQTSTLASCSRSLVLTYACAWRGCAGCIRPSLFRREATCCSALPSITDGICAMLGSAR